MKILHTADWHLGRFLHGAPLLELQQELLSQILDTITTEKVDVVVVAGDIYDRAVPPKEAIQVLNEFVRELNKRQIPMIMITGNHDSSERLNFATDLLKSSGLHILADLSQVHEPVVLEKNNVNVNIYGIPFAEPEKVREAFQNEVRTFDEAHSFLVEHIKQNIDLSQNNLLMSHCFVTGAKSSESEKTLSVGGSDIVSFEPMVDFDYVALGHLHAPQKQGADHIRYSGSLMKYSFSEHQQKKGVTLLEFDTNGLASHKHIDLKPSRDVRQIEGLLEDILEIGRQDPNAEDFVLIRLLDETSLLEPMARLREVYPNVLVMDRKRFQINTVSAERNSAEEKQPIEMVEDFYRQSVEKDLSEPQRKILISILEKIHGKHSGDSV